MTPMVIIEAYLYMMPHATEEVLVSDGFLAHEDSRLHEPPRVLQYLCVIPCLPCLQFGYCLTEVYEEMVLPSRCDQGLEGEPRATPKVIRVFPQGGTAKTLKDQVVILVVPGVSAPKEMAIRPQDVINPELHLLPQTCHTTRPSAPVSLVLLRKKVLQQIL